MVIPGSVKKTAHYCSQTDSYVPQDILYLPSENTVF